MKIAAIDIGTNSVRLVLAEVGSDSYRPLKKYTVITRLGKGISFGCQLDSNSVELTIREIKKYLNLAKDRQVEVVVLAGTQALREVKNSYIFLDRLKNETGLECLVISAQKEGKLMFKAVSQAFNLPPGAVVFDVGGGSTEFVYKRENENGEVEKVVSLPLGAVRLSELYLLSDPPAKEEINKLREKTRKDLKRLRGLPKGVLYGVAGTVTTLVAVANQLDSYDPDLVHGYYLKREEIEKTASLLSSLSLKERKKVKGLESERADVIIGGAFLTLEIVDFFEAQGLVVSECDLLDGLALSWKELGQPLN